MISTMTSASIRVVLYVGEFASAVWAGSARGNGDAGKGKIVKAMIRWSKKKEAARTLHSEERIV
jgi:hypothetical protein